ncbi:hypothetical protein B0H14DRAFT_1177562 [Mycena olivaceomarginata]|nr:hypothetical protein B0H14DRAFT_1177562 [Mycena olivaceomarginata]
MDGSSLNASCDSFLYSPPLHQYSMGANLNSKVLLHTLVTDSASVAILGPGGNWKDHSSRGLRCTIQQSLKSMLPGISSPCESANTRDDLLASIGSHLGLEPSKQLSKTILSHLRQSESCLILLDNFETPWERTESRSQVEEFLSLLSAIPNLALLITMRGAERPGKVKWHRPFLPPLEPLSSCASRQIFLDIADEPGTGEESALNDLLDLSGSLPLAVSLMANIASFEGYLGTLRRWRIENTTLLSDGHDKRSNLEKSINLLARQPTPGIVSTCESPPIPAFPAPRRNQSRRYHGQQSPHSKCSSDGSHCWLARRWHILMQRDGSRRLSPIRDYHSARSPSPAMFFQVLSAPISRT